MRRRVWKHLGLGALVLLGVMQAFRPDMTNPPTDPAMTLEALYAPPPEVAKLLRAGCYDCHSHATRWPWYSQVAPVSWLVAHDVEHAREMMNFSTFAAEAPEDRAFYLEACARQVREQEMPLPNYTRLHADARFSEEERERLAAWFEEAAGRAR
jgi:hypothetical protein